MAGEGSDEVHEQQDPSEQQETKKEEPVDESKNGVTTGTCNGNGDTSTLENKKHENERNTSDSSKEETTSEQQAPPEPPKPTPAEQQAILLAKLHNSTATAGRWEHDADLLRHCRSLIPLHLVNANCCFGAAASDESSHCNHDGSSLLFPPSVSKWSKYSRPQEGDGNYTGDDLLLKRLAVYFQKDFMTWVSSPPCDNKDCEGCEGKDMVYLRMRREETAEERDGLAKRVEVYQCPKCSQLTTFPRYNTPAKLLETRRGRCGEYAILFGFLCRSLGYDVRYIVDFTDHVWIDVWSPTQNQYLMADSCEGKIDVNGMYEKGWGKKLSYILAFSSGCGEGYPHVTDVTKRYNKQFASEAMRQRRVDAAGKEEMVAMIMAQVNADLQLSYTQPISKGRREELERREREEEEFLHQKSQEISWEEEAMLKKRKSGGGGMKWEGRISGSLEWKASRKELGDTSQKNDDKTEAAPKEEEEEEERYVMESFLPKRLLYNPSNTSTPAICTMTARYLTQDDIAPTTANTEHTPHCTPLPFPNAITISTVPCAVGRKGMNVVIVDEATGCILQSRLLQSWKAVDGFLQSVPDGRFVVLSSIGDVSSSSIENEKEVATQYGFVARLGGFVLPKGVSLMELSQVAFVGQMGFLPFWATMMVDGARQGTPWPGTVGIHVEVDLSAGWKKNGPPPTLALREETNVVPQNVSCRLPESIMPLQTQLRASPEQKHMAINRFFEKKEEMYVGYTTKPGQAVYLLSATAFPLQRVKEKEDGGSGEKEGGWVTHYFLPEPMVPKPMDASALSAQAPTDVAYFSNLFGPNLLSCSSSNTVSTAQAVEGKRLIALYFSAHWCPPCRQFTPMLAEFYSTAKEESPWDLELVFVSSDRDPGSYRNYTSSMPWLAVPFEDRGRAQMIGSRYGVQGLPTLVVLDGLSGQVVAQQSARNDVTSVAYRGGDDAVKEVLQKWNASAPEESKFLMESIELSLKDAAEESQKKALEDAQTGYLVRKMPDNKKKEETTTPADRIKVYFATLVASGKDPTTAAAEAIQLVAQESVADAAPPPKLEVGCFASGSWSVVQSGDCVSAPIWQTEDSAEFVHFSDAAMDCQLSEVCGVRLLHSSSVVSGIQTINVGGKQGSAHRRDENVDKPSKDGDDWTEQTIDGTDNSEVRGVQGMIGPLGITNLRLVNSSPDPSSIESDKAQENSSENPFSLTVPEGSHLAGFHGTFGPNGILSLGLVCNKKQGNLSPAKTVEDQEPSMASLALPSMVKSAATKVLLLNKENKNAKAKTVLTTAKKYLDNTMRDPFNPKFRMFKLSNKVSDRICQVAGGVDLLCALGFTVSFVVDEFHVGVPLGANLEGMDQAIRLLLEQL